MDASMFDGIGKMINCMFIACVIFVPLGLWKLIDIIIWLFQHVDINWVS